MKSIHMQKSDPKMKLLWLVSVGAYSCLIFTVLINIGCTRKQEEFRPGYIKGFKECYEKGLEAGQMDAVWQADLCQDKEAFHEGYSNSERQKAVATEKANAIANLSKKKHYASEKQRGIAAYKVGDYDAFNRSSDNPGFRAGWSLAEEEYKNKLKTERELGEIAFAKGDFAAINGDYAALALNKADNSFYRGWQFGLDRVKEAELQNGRMVFGIKYRKEIVHPPEVKRDAIVKHDDAIKVPEQESEPTSVIVELMDSALRDAELECQLLRIPDDAIKARIKIINKHIAIAARSIGMTPDNFVRECYGGVDW